MAYNQPRSLVVIDLFAFLREGSVSSQSEPYHHLSEDDLYNISIAAESAL